jgi:hypothetical protein
MSQGTKEKKKEGQGGRKEIELAPAYLQDFLTSPPCTSCLLKPLSPFYIAVYKLLATFFVVFDVLRCLSFSTQR